MTINNSDDCISHGTVLVPEGIKAQISTFKIAEYTGGCPPALLAEVQHCLPSLFPLEQGFVSLRIRI